MAIRAIAILSMCVPLGFTMLLFTKLGIAGAGNLSIYLLIFQQIIHFNDWTAWFHLLLAIPSVLIQCFFYSNFIIKLFFLCA